MEKCIKNILSRVVIVTVSVFSVTACTPRVIVDQFGSTIQVEHDPAGATSVRVTPRDEPNPARPTPMAPTPPVVVTEARPETDTARRELADLKSVQRELAAVVKERDQTVNDRDKAAGAAQQAQRTAATLREEVNRLTASKAAMERELGDLTIRRDKTRTEIADGQGATEALAAEIKRLAAQKLAAEQGLSTATTNLANAKSALTAADTAAAASENRLTELKKKQADAEAALATAQAKLEGVTVDTTKATADRDDRRSQIEARKRELAELAAKPNAAVADTQGGAPTDVVPKAMAPASTNPSPATPSKTDSPHQAGATADLPQTNSLGDSRQVQPALTSDSGWHMASLGATAVLGLAAVAGILTWLAPRASYTYVLHSLKTGHDVSQAIGKGREGVVLTADGAATMTPVECLHPGDTYLGVTAFGSPVLSAGDGVSVNGETVSRGSSVKLRPGARISMGPNAAFEFRSCLRSDARDESETAVTV